MKKGIVLKLFILTTALCTLILITIFIGQTIFFKQYYANRKVNDIKKNIQSFEKAYVKAGNDVDAIQELEQNFYQENTTWVTTLDKIGNIKYANEFSLEIQLDPNQNKTFSQRLIQIPLYSFIDLEDIQRVKYSLEQDSHIIIDGVQEGDAVVPAMLTIKEKNFGLENKQLSERLYGPKAAYLKERAQLYLAGSIKKVQLPEGTVGTNSIYRNRVFIDRIKQFQVDLILNQNPSNITSTEIVDYEENDIKYKLLIKPTIDADGKENYIFAMTSLQPVDEAVQMIKDYYIYLIIFVLILIVLISFYYSKKIAKPLLQINDTTKKIAGLDFSETIPITTKDEIGDLSQNINTLSKALHSYINQLQQDIEKEKQLENTRKEFIAGVSHELKTPLSIMKSCISILEDGVASNKKDYYFKAMSKEVDKMDMLIIDMLELAKFESGTYKMEMDVFHIDEMIDYICEQLTSDITAKQLHVHKQLSKIEVVANPHRIEQVITNFITNAIRYTPEHENIIISTIEENERVKVCIENKGAHIAPEHLEKIWDRFYRGDTSRQRSKGGTGLGLAISRNILDLHGVEYGVLNTEDGVLFFFYLNKDV
ncbi:two-component sensor histidine kinase [Bacillus toyonensis]|uniref:sensor histidine kinase n=1 Tax=Bacillus toyonensis TaxID=155322 RepID=UPI000BF194B2|nr:HAMP domain-containing sensor histidine kinase [Bacillus toyonensis]PEO55496.1 two-component sensor histidine kinase [Bacillus toyonensis]PFX69956.1 two-component sensor histidine kinase [Bacillus toyonensis]PFX76709.1 two-component sensor histidine kinase [Bacillus toyonensis]PHF47434.1 two-component sensor histidine kinase [Bacillus toyonensis]